MQLLPLLFPLLVSLTALVASVPAASPVAARQLDNPPRLVREMKRALLGSEKLARRSIDAVSGVKRSGAEQHARKEGGELKRRAEKGKRRCYYVGTFFHLIDCNAPANSTRIPYAPSASATAATKAG
ncbi:hypothetical protein JCM10213_004653 [Rhodosporidiobolus nylandii]